MPTKTIVSTAFSSALKSQPYISANITKDMTEVVKKIFWCNSVS
jgi:hypothetical protein